MKSLLRPVLVTAAAAPLLTTAEAKQWCRVDHDDEDQLFPALIAAAEDRLDGWTGILGRCLVHQTWRQDFPGWPADGELRLPFPDVSATGLTVKYSDADDAEQTLAASQYELLEDATGALLRLRSGFSSPALYDDRCDPVRVQFVAGYGAVASAVPQALRTAALMMVAHWYANREALASAIAETPNGVGAIVSPYARHRI
jgi:uncharacterized phiE125 gp8 family phage protein